MKYLGRSVGRVLIAHGLAPANCVKAEIVIEATGVLCIRYEVQPDEKDVSKLVDVFKELASMGEKPDGE